MFESSVFQIFTKLILILFMCQLNKRNKSRFTKMMLYKNYQNITFASETVFCAQPFFLKIKASKKNEKLKK